MFKIALNYIREHKYVLLALYVPVYLISFFLIENLVATNGYWVSYLPLDDSIPFCEWFIFPYWLWYPSMATVGIWLLIKDPPAFKRYMFFMIIGFSSAILTCIIFPNGQDLRPVVFEHDNIATTMVKMIYSADTNTNVIPSVHVIGAMAVFFGAFDTKTLRKFWIQALNFLIAAVVSISTVFVKQHSVLDIFAGLAYCAVIYVIVYVLIKSKMEKKEIVK